MKAIVYCPKCKETGHRPQMLCKYEDVVGRGDLYLFCKKCRKEVHIRVEDISLDG